MRFVSAQLDAYISNDVWFKECKTWQIRWEKKLSEGLAKHNSIKLAYPTVKRTKFLQNFQEI